MAEVIHWSPSKVKTHRLCRRKFYGQTVEKWTIPQHPGAAFGEDVHELAGFYLIEGLFPATDVPYDWKHKDRHRAVRTTEALLPYLPEPGSVDKAMVEKWAIINEATFERKMRGRIDWLEHISSEPLRWVRVNDFKTTSNLSYALTEAQLRRDPQAICYAAWCFIKLGAEKVTVRFLYVCTRSPHHTKIVEVTYAMEDVIGPPEEGGLWYLLVEEDLEVMAETVELESFADVPPTLTACSAYGGCHYRTKCAALGVDSLGAFSSVFDKTKEKEPIQMDKLKRKKKWSPDDLDGTEKKQASMLDGQGGDENNAANINPESEQKTEPEKKAPEKTEPEKTEPEKTEPEKTQPTNGEIKGYTLFVGCMPSRADYFTIEEICEPLLQDIVANVQEKELDPFARQFPGHPFTIQYGRGKAALQAVLLQQRKNLVGNIVCRTGSDLTRCALDVLMPRAVEVIRAC